MKIKIRTGIRLIDFALPLAVAARAQSSGYCKPALEHKGSWSLIMVPDMQPATNIELVLCGHISREGYCQDLNVAGKPVRQVRL